VLGAASEEIVLGMMGCKALYSNRVQYDWTTAHCPNFNCLEYSQWTQSGEHWAVL